MRPSIAEDARMKLEYRAASPIPTGAPAHPVDDEGKAEGRLPPIAGHPAPAGLAAKRILIVEDEPLISLLLEDMLVDLGCVVAGSAFDLAEGERLARDETIDAAIIDLNLDGQTSHSVAALLDQRGIPYLLATGYGQATDFTEAANLLHKPYRASDLRSQLERILR